MPVLGKMNVTTVPIGAVMLAGLNVNELPEPTLTFICPGVFAVADGEALDTVEEVEDVGDTDVVGPY